MRFRFADIFRIAFELIRFRPGTFLWAFFGALFSLLIWSIFTVVLPSYNTAQDVSNFTDNIAAEMQSVSLTEGLPLGGFLLLLLVLQFAFGNSLRRDLLAPLVAPHAQPTQIQTQRVSLGLLLIPTALTCLLLLVGILLWYLLASFVGSTAASVVAPVMLLIAVLILVPLLLVMRLALLYAAVSQVSTLTALRLALQLLRTRWTTSFLSFLIITISLASFTGLSEAAMLIALPSQTATEPLNVLIFGECLFISSTLAFLTTEAFWSGFFVLIASAKTPITESLNAAPTPAMLIHKDADTAASTKSSF